MKPFLKWAGGKRWLTYRVKKAGLAFERYIEPFLGSGAVFFAFEPHCALLSDSNAHLMETFAALRDSPLEVQQALERHSLLHSESHYYHVRQSKPPGRADRAARFIYLNRTCWNGLYRENKFGEFNVPKGTKSAVLLPDDDFARVGELLRHAGLSAGDFEKTIEQASAGDFIFVDPPYTVKHNRNGFIKYNERIFSWDDQVRLSACLHSAGLRGAKILLTNAYHPSVLGLYNEFAEIIPLSRHSVLSGLSQYRGPTQEALITINLKAAEVLSDELPARRSRGIFPIVKELPLEALDRPQGVEQRQL